VCGLARGLDGESVEALWIRAEFDGASDNRTRTIPSSTTTVSFTQEDSFLVLCLAFSFLYKFESPLSSLYLRCEQSSQTLLRWMFYWSLIKSFNVCEPSVLYHSV